MNCRLCDSNELSLLYQQGSHNQFNFYQCKKCKLVNLDLESISMADHQQKYFTDYVPRLITRQRKKHWPHFSS